MKVGPVAHGALLVAALGFAYQTWTRTKSEPPKAGTVTVWKESADNFQSFAYDGDSKSVRVERREDKGQAYLWGKVTEQKKKPHARIPIHTPNPQAEAEKMGAAQEAKFKDKEEAIKRAAQEKKKAGKDGKGGDKKAPPPHGLHPAPVDTVPHKKVTPVHKPAPAAGGAGKAPQSPHYAHVDPPAAAAAGKAKPAAAPAKANGAKGASKPAKPGAAKPAAGAAKPAAAPAKPGASTPAKPGAAAAESPTDHGDESGQSTDDLQADDDTITTTREFPVGKAGDDLVDNLSHLHALRDLGVLTDKQKNEYGLADSKENLTVFFKNGVKHSLLIGARVFGGSDRYALEPDSGKGYVLSNSEILRFLSGAETALGLRNLHAFERADADQDDENIPNPQMHHQPHDKYSAVSKIDIQTPDNTKTLVKNESDDPATGGHKVSWADARTPDQSDLSFANFLSQIERLRPLEYDPKLDAGSLTRVLTIRYHDKSGKVIGTFDLYKKAAPVTPELNPSDAAKNQVEYYVHTELTRVLGKVSRMAADRVAEDLPQIFGEQPKDGGAKGASKAPTSGANWGSTQLGKGALPPFKPGAMNKAAQDAAAKKAAAGAKGGAAGPSKPAGSAAHPPAGNHAGAAPSPKAGNK